MSVLAHKMVNPFELAILAVLIILGAIGLGMCGWVGVRIKKDRWRQPQPLESIIGLIGMTLVALGWAALWWLLES